MPVASMAKRGRPIPFRYLARGVALVVFLAGTTAPPVAAQSMLSAANDAMQLGLSICLENAGDLPGAVAALSTAGFAYTAEPSGDGSPGMIHWFQGPMASASVTLSEGDGGILCTIGTDQMGVTDTIPFTGAMLTALSPGRFTFAEADGSTPVTPETPDAADRPCTGYVSQTGQPPVTITIGNDAADTACVDDGSAQIMVRM